MPKQKRYWLRGGIIGLFGSLVFFWVKVTMTTSEVVPPICLYDGGWEKIGIPCSEWKYIFYYYKGEVILTVLVFMFLGLLYGKFNNRKIGSSLNPKT